MHFVSYAGGEAFRFTVGMQHAVCELRERAERGVRRLAMRGMAGAFEDRYSDRAVAFRFGDLDLAQCPIMVVRALDDCDGDADIGEVFRDVPVAEFRVEPGAVPAIERVVDIAVPARELLLQVCGLVDLLDLGNRGDRNVLDNEIRRY